MSASQRAATSHQNWATAFVALFMLFGATVSYAGGAKTYPAVLSNTAEYQLFVVSGVLRRSTNDVVIKLVQSIERARSSEEAIGQFTRKITHEYGGYSLWDTLVTPVPQARCVTTI